MSRRRCLANIATTAVGLAAAPHAIGDPERGDETPGPRTEVRTHLGRPMFFVDGRPCTKPVCETYAPHTFRGPRT